MVKPAEPEDLSPPLSPVSPKPSPTRLTTRVGRARQRCREDARRGMPPLSPPKHPGGPGFGGESNRDGWLVNTSHRGLDGPIPSAPNYLANLQTAQESEELVDQVTVQAARRSPVKGPTGKRETAITMSRMLKSLLDELDVEYGYRKLEWNKVEHVLVGRVSRLQDSIRTAQKTNAETITSVQNVLREVFMRTIFSRWRTFSMARQNRKRICSHVTWWFKSTQNEEAQLEGRLTRCFVLWKLQHARRTRMAKLEHTQLEHLRALHEGDNLVVRFHFACWKLVRMKAVACSTLMGCGMATGPNAAKLRKQVAKAWLKLGRMRLAKERTGEAGLARYRMNTTLMIMLQWRRRVIQGRAVIEKAEARYKVLNISKWLFICYHLWARQAHRDTTDREVEERVQKYGLQRERQNKVWQLRVAELKNAIAEAKKWRDVHGHAAPASVVRTTTRGRGDFLDRGESNFPNWKPPKGKKIPGFFRTPGMAPDVR